MLQKLLPLYEAANKNRLYRAVAAGALLAAGTAYLSPNRTVQSIANAAIAGAVLAGVNFVRNPEKGNVETGDTTVTSDTKPAS